MNKYHTRFNKKENNFNNRQYHNRNYYYNKRNQYNNKKNYYQTFNRRKYDSYDIYEEEISYDKETTISTEAPSIKDDSFSQSSNSTSRKHSYCESNNDSSENSSSFIIFENNKLDNSKIDNIPKINLSEKELESAYYKPKNYKDTSITENKDNKKYEDENINILEINIKISKEKTIFFKLRKYDDMFQVVQETCKDNELSEDYVNFFIYTIIKALNSIYGIYNLKLKEEEINTLKTLNERCNSN